MKGVSQNGQTVKKDGEMVEERGRRLGKRIDCRGGHRWQKVNGWRWVGRFESGWPSRF